MALSLQDLNFGTYDNDNTGDDLRTAFTKVQANFDSIEAEFYLSEVSSDESITDLSSTAGTSIIKEVIAGPPKTVKLKSLTAGTNVSIVSSADTLTISSAQDVALINDTNPTLANDLQALGFDIVGAGVVSATTGTFDSVIATTISGYASGVTSISDHSLSELQDVQYNSGTLEVGDTLVWDGISWVTGLPLGIPKFTTTQRDALTPVNAMMIYNETTDTFQGYAGGSWVDLH